MDQRPVLFIYGDLAYPLCPHLMTPFRAARITPIENEWNKWMSNIRTSVEWILGDITTLNSLTLKKDQSFSTNFWI